MTTLTSNNLPRSLAARIPATKQFSWPDLLLILLLTLLPLLFFWRLITPNPADRMQIAPGDFTEQYFPLRAFTAQEWVSGRLPLWNPYLYGGQPALADIQSGALYPPHLLEALVLGWGGPLFGQEIGFPLQALAWQMIAHFSLAAVGTYLFFRHLGRQAGASLKQARFGGLVASLVFTYSGYLTGFPVQQVTILEVSAWLPWLLWGLSAANGRGSTKPASRPAGHHPTQDRIGEETPSAPRPAVAVSRFIPHPSSFLAALALAMALLAGHPQTVLYIFYLSLAYTAFLAFQRWQDQERSASIIRPFGPSPLPLLAHSLVPPVVNWLVVILLGTAVAAAQLLPTLEFISRSVRANLSYQAVSAGLPLNELISILYPGFFGGSPEYVGIATLVLIALALVLARPRRAIFFWGGAALVSLLLAFGGNTFLYPLFYLFAPGFEAVRQQERAFLVYSFSAAVLAGYGAIVLVKSLPKQARQPYRLFEHRLRMVAIVAGGVTAFYIYGSAAATARGEEVNLFFGLLRHHLFGLIVLGGMLLLLALRPRRWLRRPWGMALVAVWLAFNLFTVNWPFNLAEVADVPPFAPSGVIQFLQVNVGPIADKDQGSLLSPARIASGGLLAGGHSAASVYQLQDITGNTPLHLAAVANFLQQLPSWRMWQLMNVLYIVDKREIADEGLALVFQEDELKLFEMKDPFPRAWFVGKTEIYPQEDQAIARLSADDFDLRRAAVLPQPLNVRLTAALTSTVRIIDLAPTHLTAITEASGPHLLVFSQIYYPGWQAKIDGQPVELLRVNLVQQGVIVPTGQHTVDLIFSPGSFWLGLIISAAALLLWLLLSLWSKRRHHPISTS